MSTRAAYFFKDDDSHHMVYKHHDGYPTGAAEVLLVARKLAWAGARFEADEAAASFATAAKLSSHLFFDKDNKMVVRDDHDFMRSDRGGGVRLMHASEDPKNLFAACRQCSDVQYAYIISQKDGDWRVEVYGVSFGDEFTSKQAKKLWVGPLSKMTAWAKKAAGK